MKLILLLAALPLLAQRPPIVNAQLETHAVQGSLDAEMKRLAAGNGPMWAGYAEPMIPGDRWMCDSDSRNSATSVKLEGPGTLVVLFRMSDHAIEKVRTHSVDCQLDAGGLPFHWLTGVSPAESVRYLVSLASAQKHTIPAIALHADPAADAALLQLASPSQPESVRRDVVFWMGSARGRRGFEALKQILPREPDQRVREHIMFALSVSKEPGATALLIESARNDRDPNVRSKALFWLAHKAGQKETAEITRAISEDPDTHVKKQAVFALKQLPEDQGIPLLIQVARTNKNPEVRKQALFWLGQSHDPRALKYFEEVLGK